MNRKLSILTLMVLMTLVIGASGATAHETVEPAGPSSPAAALGTAFTYQGYLTDGGSPASGTFDFEFGLYDDPDIGEGTLLGTVIVGDEPVTDGFFTVELDFGGVFDGPALYLEVGVRPGSSGAFTTLSPRQALTPTPAAIYAMNAPWSGLNDVPAGFADGTDDNTTYTAGEGLALNGRQFSAQGSSYGNVVVVAKSGGDFTSVQAAVNSITGADADNPYLVWVAPGVYSETVTMKPWVDIEGAGELVTKITYTGSSSGDTGTVVGADNAELRFLTVENTGGEDYATAIYNDGQSPRLTHVTATASGGTNNRGVYNSYSSPKMTNVTATASGGTNNRGVYNSYSSPQMTDVTATASGGTVSTGVYNESSLPQMTNVTASASGGGDSNNGVYNNSSSPQMTDVTATASGGTHNTGVYNSYSSPTMTDVTATASGGTESIGVLNYSSSSPTMTNVTATASGGTTHSIGVSNFYSSPQMTNVTATASGETNNYGVSNSASSPTINNSVIEASWGTNNYGIINFAGGGFYNMKANNSQITGDDATIYSDVGFTTYVGASLLNGGAVVPNSGTMTCVGAYNEGYTALNGICE